MTSLGHVPVWALLTLGSALFLYGRAGCGRLTATSLSLVLAFAFAIAKELSDAAIDSAYISLAGHEINLAGAPDLADVVLDFIGMALAVPLFLTLTSRPVAALTQRRR